MRSADDDRELIGRPLRRARERDAHLHGIEQGCALVAPAEVQHAQLAAAVGELERDARVADQVDVRFRRGASASRDRWRGPGVRRTRRGSRARPRGTAPAARARGPWDRRTPPAAAARARPARGARPLARRFDTAKRMSADLLAWRFPPACSRASLRRHMSSARFSIAVVTRGASASPSTRRTVPATCDNVRRTRPPGPEGRGQYTRSDAYRDRRRPRGLSAEAAPRERAGEVGPRRERPRDRQHRRPVDYPPYLCRGRPRRRAAARPTRASCSAAAGRASRSRPTRCTARGPRSATISTRRAWRASTTTRTSCRSARASSPPSWPRRSPRSSSTRRSRAGAISAASTRSPTSNTRRPRSR